MPQTAGRAAFRQLLWDGGEEVSIGRLLAAGAVLCLLYSVLQIFLNGVVYDETVVPAQIVSGAVKYPPGHPHDIFYRQAFSLPQFLHGWLWWLAPDPLLHSAERNLWFLFLSLLVPYSSTVVLTRRPMWGHLAAVLAATETMLQFKGTYPQWIFPGFYSNGHFGLQLAVLVPALLLGRCWRIGGFLLGLLPAFHAAMAIVVWPWAALYFFFAANRPVGRDCTRFFVAAVLGVALTAAFAGYLLVTARSLPVEAPYLVDADAAAIHRMFTKWTDTHRQLLTLISLGYLGAPVALGALGALAWWLGGRAEQGTDHPRREPLAGLLLLGAVAIGIVYLCGAYQWMFGSLPWFVERSMPNRFSNIAALLLMPVTCAALAGVYEKFDSSRRSRMVQLLSALLGFAVVLRALEGRGIPYLYSGRVENNLIYLLWGLLLALLFFLPPAAGISKWRTFLPAMILIGVLALLIGETRGVVYLLAAGVASGLIGFLLRLHREAPNTLAPSRPMHAVLVLACILLAAVVIPDRRLDPWDRSQFRWDVLSPYDVALREWLSRNARPGELILPALFPRLEIQPKAGFPVLAELETLYIMTYMPSQSGVIGTMAKELYGLDYTDPEYLRRAAEKGRGRVRPEPAWQAPWAKRTRAEWQALARKYKFRLVLSYYETPLDLPVALPGSHWNLYKIPED